MDFLKTFFGDKALTYDELVQLINAHNGIPENAQKQIKLANLGEGGYVSKDKYADLEGKLGQANTLIEDLRQTSQGNEELQAKITAYDTQLQEKEAEIQQLKIKTAIKVAFLKENVDDEDYLTFKLEQKLKEEGKALELDDNGNIKGWDDCLKGLKTQYPSHFGNGGKDPKIDPLPLQKGDPGKTTPTKEDFRKMSYNERVKLKEENEELFKQLNSKN